MKTSLGLNNLVLTICTDYYSVLTFSLLAPTCPPLTAPANGDIDCSLGEDGEANPGDTCTFTCDDDFEAVGSSSRVCMNDESWSGTQPRCVQSVFRYCHNWSAHTTKQQHTQCHEQCTLAYMSIPVLSWCCILQHVQNLLLLTMETSAVH